MSLTELGCYCGAALSALIARRLLLMDQLTFINRILLLYFTIDAVMGLLETYFSFKLYRERLEEARMHIEIHNHFTFSLLDDEEKQIDNCIVFMTIWMLWNPHRMLVQFAILFIGSGRECFCEHAPYENISNEASLL